MKLGGEDVEYVFLKKDEMRKKLNKKGALQATVAGNKRRSPCHPPTEPTPQLPTRDQMETRAHSLV